MATAMGSPAAWTRHDLEPQVMVRHAVIAMAVVTVLDLTDGRLGFVFSLGFVLVALTMPFTLDVRSLLPAGVLPPVLLVGSLLVVAILHPSGIQVEGMPTDANALGRTIAAVVDHGVTLVLAQVLALAGIGARLALARRTS